VYGALLTLGLASCADPVFYQQRIYVTEPRLNMTRINGAGYQIDFPADGVRLPESLLLADSGEVLAGGACPTESLVGIALYPGMIIASDIDVTNETPALDIVENGPAVVSVVVGYQVPYTCTGTTPRLSGTSTFTLFPSSRIVRHDVVRATDMALTSNPGCGCAAGNTGPFIFTSYWMFNTPQLVNPSNAAIPVGSAGPSVCAAVGVDLVALQWDPGATRVERPMNAAATVYDLFRCNAVDNTPREITSSLQVGYRQTDCGDVLQGLANPPLTIDGREVTMNADGIYEDRDAHVGGEFQIIADDGSVPPFAVLLNLGPSRHVRVSRSEGSYSVQPAAGGGSLFWFDDGLADNESIYITPY
jgi:hypothetical protein